MGPAPGHGDHAELTGTEISLVCICVGASRGGHRMRPWPLHRAQCALQIMRAACGLRRALALACSARRARIGAFVRGKRRVHGMRCMLRGAHAHCTAGDPQHRTTSVRGSTGARDWIRMRHLTIAANPDNKFPWTRTPVTRRRTLRGNRCA
eukprot:9162867-Pyramimonas_sp.AAC.1